jgi:hypothetical protein
LFMFWENEFEVFRVVDGIKYGENSTTRISDYAGSAEPPFGRERAQSTHRYA